MADQQQQPDLGVSASEASNANLLNQKLSDIIESLGTANADTVAQLMDIASAITSSIIGGTTGVTANRLLRSKGTSGFALQNSAVTLDNSAVMSGVADFLIGFTGGVQLGPVQPHIEVASADGNAAVGVVRFSNDNGASRFVMGKSRGTTIPTNTIVQDGDLIGRLIWVGADGTNYPVGAEIVGIVDGTPGTSNDMPMMIEFRTTPDGSATPVLRWVTRANGTTQFSYQAGFVRTSLTDASTIAWDARLNQSAYVLLTSGVGATRALGAPSNLVSGFTYILVVQQSSTGSNALTYNAVYKWPGGVAPVLSTANNAIDILTFISDGTNMYGVAQKGFA